MARFRENEHTLTIICDEVTTDCGYADFTSLLRAAADACARYADVATGEFSEINGSLTMQTENGGGSRVAKERAQFLAEDARELHAYLIELDTLEKRLHAGQEPFVDSKTRTFRLVADTPNFYWSLIMEITYAGNVNSPLQSNWPHDLTVRQAATRARHRQTT